jgi:hypothetical protein
MVTTVGVVCDEDKLGGLVGKIGAVRDEDKFGETRVRCVVAGKVVGAGFWE